MFKKIYKLIIVCWHSHRFGPGAKQLPVRIPIPTPVRVPVLVLACRYFAAFLPGVSYFAPAIPLRPVDRSSVDESMAHFIPTGVRPACWHAAPQLSFLFWICARPCLRCQPASTPHSALLRHFVDTLSSSGTCGSLTQPSSCGHRVVRANRRCRAGQ